MTRIDFYVLPDDDRSVLLQTVCKLAEKAVRQSKKVFINTDDDNLASSLDEALWAFRKDSFLPHCTIRADDNVADDIAARDTTASMGYVEPVAIGCGKPLPCHDRTVLINLGQEVPPYFSRFERTLEVINQQQDIRDSGRARYSFYQQRGYPLKHHKL